MWRRRTQTRIWLSQRKLTYRLCLVLHSVCVGQHKLNHFRFVLRRLLGSLGAQPQLLEFDLVFDGRLSFRSYHLLLRVAVEAVVAHLHAVRLDAVLHIGLLFAERLGGFHRHELYRLQSAATSELRQPP